jgi:hypothetical protein
MPSLSPNSMIPLWENEGSSRIPFWTYTNESVYQRELERIFYKKHWSYVGLEAEIPNHGDFKRTAFEPDSRGSAGRHGVSGRRRSRLATIRAG